LEMYCAFHRLLLDFTSRYPELMTSCRNKVKGFIQSEERRSNDKVPNLGEFLVLMSVVDFSWESIVDVFVIEVLQRSWFWILRYHPEFQKMSLNADKSLVTFMEVSKEEKIVENAFDGARRSLRIVMLHSYFLRNVTRPRNCSREEVIHQYDVMFGQPSARMKDEFESACKEIMAISTFTEFFQWIGYADTPQSTSEMALLLRGTAAQSLRKEYHSVQPKDHHIERGYVMIG